MRYFSNLGSCCFRPATVAAEPPEVKDEEEEEVARRAIANVNTPLLTSRELGRAKRKGCSGAHWRPALSVISEDGAVSFSEGRDENRNVIQSAKKASIKGKWMAKNKNHNYHHHSLGNDGMQMVIPAIPPAPFLF